MVAIRSAITVQKVGVCVGVISCDTSVDVIRI